MVASKETYTYNDNPYLSVPSIEGERDIFPREMLHHSDNLELEIGFGRGRFIRDRAAVAGNIRILGIETKRKLVYLCAQKAEKLGLGNLTVLHGDARSAVARMVPDGCFKNVFVNFPDPWWKAKHKKRMVVTDALTEQIVRLLEKGGQYFVQTDVDFRAKTYQKVLLNNLMLAPVGNQDGYVAENHFNARSSRERRCEEMGLPIYRLLFKKR